MNVSPYDLPFRWLVESSDRDDVSHLVEFPSESGGRAECSCEHYQFRIRPALDAGSDAEDCKHIREARRHFHAWALKYHEEQQQQA